MPMPRIISAVLTAVLLSAAAVALTPAAAHADSCAAGADNDFDGDGIRDLAVGASLGADGGRVVVTYSRTGATVEIGQQTPGVPGTGAEGDNFGLALASYDRDADNCDDLVVGAPFKTVAGEPQAGAVWILPGSPTGLVPSAAAMFTQDTAGFPGAVERDDYFGYSLAAGLTGTQPYLLIGAPGEMFSDGFASGVVYYQRGGKTVTVHQDTTGVADSNEFLDWWGDAITATPAHVFVGVRGENSGGEESAGSVVVFRHASTGGLTPVATISQD